MIFEYHAAYYKDEGSNEYTGRMLDFPDVDILDIKCPTLKSAQSMIRHLLRLSAEIQLLDRLPLPKPNPRARDKKATLTEVIALRVAVSIPLSR